MTCQISAKVVADSYNTLSNVRLITMHLRYPRIIHSELMTHRVFSRNARSSRAVPINKMIEEIETSPFIPIHWGAAQKGMQADNQTSALIEGIPTPGGGCEDLSNEDAWLWARDQAVTVSKAFAEAGYHKQVVNRLLEPFMHIDTLVTSTEWDNWYELRDHKDAEPHIQVLAQEMGIAAMYSASEHLERGQWHLPYMKPNELGPKEWSSLSEDFPDMTLNGMQCAVSAARCARISYKPFDGEGDHKSEIERYLSLVGSKPMHASPIEHQATPDPLGDFRNNWGNFKNWIQYRKLVEASM